MTGLARSVGRFNRKVLPKEVQNPLDRKIDKKVQKLRFGPRIPQADDGPVVPLPDEEALDLARRRSRSRRRGARAATVLTGGEDDTVG